MVWWFDGELARRGESTRDRTILINQTLLTGLTLVGALVALSLGQVTRSASFVAGILLIFGAAGAAVLLPWRRLPAWAGGIVPVVDIVAIGLLRESSPNAGLGLLWTFPAMWVGAVFAVPGVIGVFVVVTAIMVSLSLADPAQTLTASTVLLPLTVVALAIVSHLAARRAAVQRRLLEKQSVHLQRSADRARRQEDLVTEVLDAVDFGVIRITPDGQLVVTNEAHARLQGAPELGHGAVSAFAADGATALPCQASPLHRARHGETFENELVWYGAPGERRRALSVTARALSDIDGSPAGTIVVSRDVTSEEHALRAREDLVASVSHELRTPLTSIVGYIELVLDTPTLPEGARRDLEVAERNAGRLLALVTDILAMSTLSRHGVDIALRREAADVAAVVAAAVESIAPRAAERRIRIDTSAVQPVHAWADAHRLRQVVDNLLSNAVKYNLDGGHVTVAVASDGADVRISVADDGPGISADEQDRLFERFFRSDTVRHSTTHGSGLGLAISHEIVRAHGGEITVRSRLGEGAAFIVRIPAGDAEGPA